jgi:hypothetical protein
MTRWPTILLVIGGGCVAVLSWMSTPESHDQTMLMNSAAADGHQMNAEALEREVRTALPVGSSLATVQDYLTKSGLEFSFESRSRTVFAIARKLQGSTSLTSKSLAFKFHFDDGLSLKSIDGQVQYTGL